MRRIAEIAYIAWQMTAFDPLQPLADDHLEPLNEGKQKPTNH